MPERFLVGDKVIYKNKKAQIISVGGIYGYWTYNIKLIKNNKVIRGIFRHQLKYR